MYFVYHTHTHTHVYWDIIVMITIMWYAICTIKQFAIYIYIFFSCLVLKYEIYAYKACVCAVLAIYHMLNSKATTINSSRGNIYGLMTYGTATLIVWHAHCSLPAIN